MCMQLYYVKAITIRIGKRPKEKIKRYKISISETVRTELFGDGSNNVNFSKPLTK